MTIKYKTNQFHGDETDVFLDGVHVATYRKRSEYYNFARAATYHYFDVYPPVTDRGYRSKDDRLGSDGTRKRALAEAFVALGLDDAARELDRDRAEHWIQQRARTS